MSPLEKRFRLELEFHRRLRTQAPGTGDASSLHTSYALQTGYEQLLPAIGTVTTHQVEGRNGQALQRQPFPGMPTAYSFGGHHTYLPSFGGHHTYLPPI